MDWQESLVVEETFIVPVGVKFEKEGNKLMLTGEGGKLDFRHMVKNRTRYAKHLGGAWNQLFSFFNWTEGICRKGN